MSTAIDHIGIPAAEPWAAARFLGEILAAGEVEPDGPAASGQPQNRGPFSLSYFGLPSHEPYHVALRVTGPLLADVIGRLRQRGVPFGNNPGDTANGRTDDPLGGAARIFFNDVEGNLFELLVPDAR